MRLGTAVRRAGLIVLLPLRVQLQLVVADVGSTLDGIDESRREVNMSVEGARRWLLAERPRFGLCLALRDAMPVVGVESGARLKWVEPQSWLWGTGNAAIVCWFFGRISVLAVLEARGERTDDVLMGLPSKTEGHWPGSLYQAR